MVSGVDGDEDQGAADVPSLMDFARAFHDPGSHPDYHRAQVEHLRQHWPTLYRLLASLPRPSGGH